MQKGPVYVSSRAEKGCVPVGQGTYAWICGEICLKPLSLGRTNPATTKIKTFRIEDDDVPIAKIIAVISLIRLTGSQTEIVEVA